MVAHACKQVGRGPNEPCIQPCRECNGCGCRSWPPKRPLNMPRIIVRQLLQSPPPEGTPSGVALCHTSCSLCLQSVSIFTYPTHLGQWGESEWTRSHIVSCMSHTTCAPSRPSFLHTETWRLLSLHERLRFVSFIWAYRYCPSSASPCIAHSCSRWSADYKL